MTLCKQISDKYRKDRMRPQEETNYIVKLEKMSAEEMMCNRKKNDAKDKWPPGNVKTTTTKKKKKKKTLQISVWTST